MELQTVRSFRVPPSGGYVTKMPLCRHGLYTSAWRGGKLFFSHFNLPLSLEGSVALPRTKEADAKMDGLLRQHKVTSRLMLK